MQGAYSDELLETVLNWVDVDPDEDVEAFTSTVNALLGELSVPLDEPIALGKFIGSGSFARVYEYREGMAVKVLHHADDLYSYDSTIKELYALMLLRGHPNVLNVIECHHVQNTAERIEDVYIVTELFERTLQDALWVTPIKLSKREKNTIEKSLIRAVKYVHSKNILHLDIKPENIYMRRDGSIVLGDFGCAREMIDNERQVTGGTPQYMRPSSFGRNQSRTRSDDMWSLACTLYALRTGVPFVTAKIDPEIKPEYAPAALKIAPTGAMYAPILDEIRANIKKVEEPYLSEMFHSSW